MMVRNGYSAMQAWRGGLAAVLVVAAPPVAHAIPSPELVVSSLSSLSQLWGVAGAFAGGGALVIGVHGRKGQDPRLQRWFKIAVAVAVAALALDVMQFVAAANEHTARLEATLVRPTPKRADGQTLDPLLREMPYSAQLKSPNGLSTNEVGELLAQMEAGRRDDVIALDIRETPETEQGGLASARAVRFPDLPQSQIDFTGKTALLFCHNGNRSAETCAALTARGVQCRFMIGGFEKWLVEGHALSGNGARTLADLRAIATYPNQSKYLDTGNVKQLVARDGAVFVDVRYPGEFDGGHLPGAINLPIRPTPTPELERRLAELPDHPVIAPCYDRRSCFFADVLGLELTRRGRTFAGRYTVPWEYFEPSTPPPHVQKWLETANASWQSRASVALADALEQASAHLGLMGAILALSALARTIVWPFASKADADQKVARAIAPEVAALKARLEGDPQRLARALRHLMARHRMTPLRNLLALLLLPVLAVSVEAVTRLAQSHPQAWAWLPELGAPDPLYALPAIFGILLAVYLSLTLAQARWHHAAIWLVAAPGLTSLAATMPAAVDVYLVGSAALLLLQRWVTSWRWAAVRKATRRLRLAWIRYRLGDPRLVALADAGRLSLAGNKAARLAALAESGLPVPGGVVLSSRFLHAYQRSDERWRRRKLNTIWRHLGARRVAVRSSAGAEDGAQQSFAGVFETVLDVDRMGLEAAIAEVAASFRAHRVGSYADDAGSANILIQPMVAARFAGVCFTRDPAIPGCALVEWVSGNGEALVSGAVTPATARIGRITGAIETDGPAPFDLAKLWTLARRIEARFGKPQDIEWAFDGRRVLILQSRDIAAGPRGLETAIAQEWAELARIAAAAASVDGARRTHASRNTTSGKRRDGEEGSAVLTLDTMAELLPHPTPSSLSLLNAFWASGGSMDRAARSLGFDAPGFDGDHPEARPLYVTAFGALYCDERERANRALVMPRRAIRQLTLNAHAFERDLRTNVLPQIAARAALYEAVDPARLPAAALLSAFNETRARLVDDTHLAVDRVNIAAQVFLEQAHEGLKRCGADPAVVLAATPLTQLRYGLRRLPGLPPAERRPALYALLGHRADLDYELAAPRYGEEFGSLVEAAQTLAATAHLPRRTDPAGDLPRDVRHSVYRAQKFVTLKEDAKHESLREVALLRRLLGELGLRFDLGGAVFYLGLDEAAALSANTRDALLETALERQQLAHHFNGLQQLPARLTAHRIERGPLGAVSLPAHAASLDPRALKGKRVSGHASVEGRAICAPPGHASGAPLPGFEPGDIIIARTLHPAWLPHLMTCGGVAVETGGWLSHMAILARERGVAMSVGVHGLEAIKTGMRLRLDADGTVVRL